MLSSSIIWRRRKRKVTVHKEDFENIVLQNELSYVYTIHRKVRECCFLHLESACKVLGLFQDDDHCNKTLEVAAASTFPARLRYLFAITLFSCQLGDTEKL